MRRLPDLFNFVLLLSLVVCLAATPFFKPVGGAPNSGWHADLC